MSARLRIAVRGAVQGVGFRPFVHRLARELGVGGWVRNEGPTVLIEAEGDALDDFVARLSAAPPRGARIDALDTTPVPPRGETALAILASAEDAPAKPDRTGAQCVPIDVQPDRVTCDACLAEVLDPASRYHAYPFTCCSECGPRWSIVDAVPYDRARTAMRAFPMCAACRAEYEDPASRRFHAEPTACPACGPRLSALGSDGRALAIGAEALELAARRLEAGEVVAVKGLGGWQLLADATSETAVLGLRDRKHRPHKPLAVLVADVAASRALCAVSAEEESLLRSPAGPIVLLASRAGGLAPGVHPDQAETGVLLPTTPLHHLLARRFARPLVCTSGNASGEPLCVEESDALERLGGVAELFLAHDRPIRRPVDDSVARVVHGAPQVLRLARGYAPLVLSAEGAAPALAFGAHQKCAPAVRDRRRIVVGAHVGDLSSARSLDALQSQAGELASFFRVAPERAARDLHPDYGSAALAEATGLPRVAVPHHAAHALALLLEHEHTAPALVLAWDGAGLGDDGTVHGGEALRVDRSVSPPRVVRVAHLRPFRLPGGDAAARDPERSLAGLLHELTERRSEVPARLRPLLESPGLAPVTSSAGRLFDGVAALLGLGDAVSYEGRAACRLERVAREYLGAPAELADLELVGGEPADGAPLVLDWAPTLRSLLDGREAGAATGALAAGLHVALARAIFAVARAVGEATVALTGGCFQSRLLTEEAAARLESDGFRVLLHRRLPPNDGALAAGQLAALPRAGT